MKNVLQKKPSSKAQLKKKKTSPEKGKGRITRNKILNAALNIFSQHPYKSASMRMIGKESGVDHPLISYYFSSKAELLNEVLVKIFTSLDKAKDKWFTGLEKEKPSEGFSLFLDRVLSYSVQHPEPFRIFALNMIMNNNDNTSPGYCHIIDFLKKIRATFIKKIPMQGTPEEIDMFINSCNAMLINYLGASSYYSQILGISPDSEEYIKWLKRILMFIFLPRLKILIYSEKEKSKIPAGKESTDL
jgi:AcrR family transcriptional regulator